MWRLQSKIARSAHDPEPPVAGPLLRRKSGQRVMRRKMIDPKARHLANQRHRHLIGQEVAIDELLRQIADQVTLAQDLPRD